MKKHFIPQNGKEDTLLNARTPITSQREMYVTECEPCKSMSNEEV